MVDRNRLLAAIGSLALGTHTVTAVAYDSANASTALGGTQADDPPPAGDTFTVFLARFTFTNATATAIGGVTNMAFFANGVLLGDHAQALADAGLGRVTVSLDADDDDTFMRMNDAGVPVAITSPGSSVMFVETKLTSS